MTSTPKAIRDHALEAHSETIDMINETIVQCIVDEKCTWKSSLKSDTLSRDFLIHLRTSHVCEDVLKAEPSELLICDIPGCTYSTRKSYNMLAHIRSHNEERRHECPVCSKKFLSSSHLRDHIKAVHTKVRYSM